MANKHITDGRHALLLVQDSYEGISGDTPLTDQVGLIHSLLVTIVRMHEDYYLPKRVL